VLRIEFAHRAASIRTAAPSFPAARINPGISFAVASSLAARSRSHRFAPLSARKTSTRLGSIGRRAAGLDLQSLARPRPVHRVAGKADDFSTSRPARQS
jgi:hypothetical protein